MCSGALIALVTTGYIDPDARRYISVQCHYPNGMVLVWPQILLISVICALDAGLSASGAFLLVCLCGRGDKRDNRTEEYWPSECSAEEYIVGDSDCSQSVAESADLAEHDEATSLAASDGVPGRGSGWLRAQNWTT